MEHPISMSIGGFYRFYVSPCTTKPETCLYAEDVGGRVADAGQRVEAEAAVLGCNSIAILNFVHAAG